MLREVDEKATKRRHLHILLGSMATLVILLLPGAVVKGLHDTDTSCHKWHETAGRIASASFTGTCQLTKNQSCCRFAIVFNYAANNSIASCIPMELCVATNSPSIAPGYYPGTNRTLWVNGDGDCSIEPCQPAYGNWKTYFWAPTVTLALSVLLILCLKAAASGARGVGLRYPVFRA